MSKNNTQANIQVRRKNLHPIFTRLTQNNVTTCGRSSVYMQIGGECEHAMLSIVGL